MSKSFGKSAYAQAGVDIDAATDAVDRMKPHIKRTVTPGVLTGVGSFGGMFALADAGRCVDPVLVSSIDSVGTKVNVAFATGRHDTIGRDLVWHCVNDILVQGARPLFFLDYYAAGELEPHVAEAIVKGLADGCQAAGCALIGGETAELPGLYKTGEYDLAGCIVGVVERSDVVDGTRVADDDVVLGLASDGLHTNGYSLARKILLDEGKLPLDRAVPELDGTVLADALLWPHRCYSQAILPLVQRKSIRAMAHITGGGFVDNIPRALPADFGVRIDVSAWEVPPLFRLIQRMGNVSDAEMFRVFNMGIGFVVIVAAKDADWVAKELTAAGERVTRLGTVERGGSGVTLEGL